MTGKEARPRAMVPNVPYITMDLVSRRCRRLLCPLMARLDSASHSVEKVVVTTSSTRIAFIIHSLSGSSVEIAAMGLFILTKVHEIGITLFLSLKPFFDCAHTPDGRLANSKLCIHYILCARLSMCGMGVKI